jgi:hypothetical protein
VGDGDHSLAGHQALKLFLDCRLDFYLQ